ncbi:hypothetical protein BTUL_0072g00150 [Botrytis tulipae]|uniref:Uncharacterized protein n=1 Tax=Botrytis tulipae TaxID=87230 RepID=A0A4Z1EWY3_9HELO|nr:hypothetical protein BTUL_0072g00150 [Botrytis tulipae]
MFQQMEAHMQSTILMGREQIRIGAMTFSIKTASKSPQAKSSTNNTSQDTKCRAPKMSRMADSRLPPVIKGQNTIDSSSSHQEPCRDPYGYEHELPRHVGMFYRQHGN